MQLINFRMTCDGWYANEKTGPPKHGKSDPTGSSGGGLVNEGLTCEPVGTHGTPRGTPPEPGTPELTREKVNRGRAQSAAHHQQRPAVRPLGTQDNTGLVRANGPQAAISGYGSVKPAPSRRVGQTYTSGYRWGTLAQSKEFATQLRGILTTVDRRYVECSRRLGASVGLPGKAAARSVQYQPRPGGVSSGLKKGPSQIQTKQRLTVIPRKAHPGQALTHRGEWH